MRLTYFRSMMYFVFAPEFKYSSLLFFHLRLKGLHIWEGRPCFLSTAHTDEEVALHHRRFQGEPRRNCARAVSSRSLETAPRSSAARPARRVSRPRSSRSSEAPRGSNGVQPLFLRQLSTRPIARTNTRSCRRRRNSATRTASPPSGCRSAIFMPSAAFRPTRRSWPVRWRGDEATSSCAAAASCCRCIIPSAWRRNGPSSTIFPRAASPFPSPPAGIRTISSSRPKPLKSAAISALQNLDIIQRLWRGETVEMPTPGGENLPVKLASDAESSTSCRSGSPAFTRSHTPRRESAAQSVLGYLMNQTVDELAEKIAAYREGRRAAGLDPAGGHVTTLLFTYLDESDEKAREVARGPLCDYLRSYLDNSQKKIEQRDRRGRGRQGGYRLPDQSFLRRLFQRQIARRHGRESAPRW